MALDPKDKRYQTLQRVFSPAAPIDKRSLLAGRFEQLHRLWTAANARGEHAVVYGERGVGKTSLARVLGDVFSEDAEVLLAHVNCHSEESYHAILGAAFEEMHVVAKQHLATGHGDPAILRTVVTKLADIATDTVTPRVATTVLKHLGMKVVIVLDEFDQVSDDTVAAPVSETIKTLSDQAVDTTIVVVGVADSVDSLIRNHASIQRAMAQIKMPRMDRKELREIIHIASEALEFKWSDKAVDIAVGVSQGLPHYTHSIGLHSTKQALDAGYKSVEPHHVQRGMRQAIESAQHSLLDAYVNATSSTHKDALFESVLLACACAKPDELGFFAPRDVHAPLAKILKRSSEELHMGTYNPHLHAFVEEESRGGVLQRKGTKKRYRYRFANPLMQPYVAIRGQTEGLVSVDDFIQE